MNLFMIQCGCKLQPCIYQDIIILMSVLSHGKLLINTNNRIQSQMILLLLLLLSTYLSLALESGLFLRNDCSCPGYNLTFECTDFLAP